MQKDVQETDVAISYRLSNPVKDSLVLSALQKAHCQSSVRGEHGAGQRLTAPATTTLQHKDSADNGANGTTCEAHLSAMLQTIFS